MKYSEKTHKPLIAVVDWKRSPRGDKRCLIEKAAIGGVARMKYFLCDKDEDWKGQLLKADVILLWHNTKMSAEIIDRLENCKAIIRNGTGYDTVDIIAAAKRDISVCNVTDYGTDEVADHSIALALALCRQILPTDKECKKLGWEIPNKEKMRRLKEMNFGIIGLGRIGTSLALKAKALGFRVFFYDPYIPDGIDKSLSIGRFKNLKDFLLFMDVVSINCPLNDETHHMITSRELKWMGKNSFLVNTARGSIVSKKDLLKALRKNIIAGAALDVIEDEPLKTKEEAATPNLIVTCHSAFYSLESEVEMKCKAAWIAKSAIEGKEELENCVNQRMLLRNFSVVK